MPNELTVPAVQPASVPGNAPASTATQAPTAPTQAPSFANPSLRLDPALGLVVIEFHNDAGSVTRSIPSQQQIDAYKRLGQMPPGPDEPRA